MSIKEDIALAYLRGLAKLPVDEIRVKAETLARKIPSSFLEAVVTAGQAELASRAESTIGIV